MLAFFGIGFMELIIIAVMLLLLIGVPLVVLVVVLLASRRPGHPPQGNQNLIPCPDCGRLVSIRATSCPQCGRPVKSEPED